MLCVPALGQGGGCAGRGHTLCVVAAGPTGVRSIGVETVPFSWGTIVCG